MTYRIVYFGTPEYAVPALEQLASDSRFEVVLVVTQPDRPSGRGHKLNSPPVKMAAEQLGIPVYQPASLRSIELRKPLVDADADLFVVAAYGLIFGEKTLSIPRIGCVNLHASILPAYRGASPISAAILEGQAMTGVSLMVMERGLDSGPVIAIETISIDSAATTGSLTLELSEVGAHLVRDHLANYAKGEIVPWPQDAGEASFVRPLTKTDGRIDWSRPAVEIERQIRAMWPWPRAWTEIAGEIVQVHQSEVANDASNIDGPIGSIGEHHRFPVVKCGSGYLQLLRVQFPGKQSLDARIAVANKQLSKGSQLDGVVAQRTPIVTRVNGESATNV